MASSPNPHRAMTAAAGIGDFSLPRKFGGRLGAFILMVATVAAYVTSFGGAMVFDDIPGIVENPTIREPWRLDMLAVAIGPQGGTLSGRPVPNLTLALNYAISGLAPWSYHALNLLIHIGAALGLFGLLRRTLNRPVVGERVRRGAPLVAFLIALLWSLHPLQSESVTYIVQRVESLMGLCYVLTLYCFARAVDSPKPTRWYVAAFAACLCGMGCKEVMVSAPLMVFAYDRTFVAGSWREAWRRRWRVHLSLLSTWIVLVCLVAASGGRGGTAGYGTGLNAWNYALTQCRVIFAYLQLALWPSGLVFDHHVRFATDLGEVWLQAIALVALLAASAWLFIRRPALGFVCAWFFVILAPTSSIVPVADAMVEHRMYLPLATVITLVVIGLQHRWSRLTLPLCMSAAVVLGIVTAFRNRAYASPITLWQDTLSKAPENPRAHSNLGGYFLEAGRLADARAELESAIRLDPQYASAHYNLAKLLEKSGDANAAVGEYEAALRANPKLADAHINLGQLYDRQGKTDQALPHFESAVILEPQASDAQAALGNALLKLRRSGPALEHLRLALELDPERADLWCSVARAHLLQRENAAARQACDKALQIDPRLAEAHYVLGNIEAAEGNLAPAVGHFRQATELAPGYVAARNNLANALLLQGEVDAAITEYRRILRDRPNDRAVQENLQRALEAQPATRR